MPIYRRAPSPAIGAKPTYDRLKMSVHFDVPPRRVWWCEWEGRHKRPTHCDEISLVDGVAGRLLTNPAPKMYGLRWEW